MRSCWNVNCIYSMWEKTRKRFRFSKYHTMGMSQTSHAEIKKDKYMQRCTITQHLQVQISLNMWLFVASLFCGYILMEAHLLYSTPKTWLKVFCDFCQNKESQKQAILSKVYYTVYIWNVTCHGKKNLALNTAKIKFLHLKRWMWWCE